MSIDVETLKLGPNDEGRALSADEFASAEFEGPWRYERVEGRLVVALPAGPIHNDNAKPWRKVLGLYWGLHPEVVDDVVYECWLRIDERNDRIGDIGVYLVKEGPHAPMPGRVPDLVVEVVSPDRVSRERDYVGKRDDYHKFGIREYVVVDRFAHRLTVLAYAPGGYVERTLTPAETYTTPLLPGLAIPLANAL